MVLAALASACGPDQRAHRSDAELLANFDRNRQAFDQLLRMAREDAALNRVAVDFVWNRLGSGEAGATDISRERWDRYRNLFREADLPDGFRRLPNEGDLVQFLSSTQGLVGDGTAKGYACSSRPLAPLVASLDHPESLTLGPTPSGDRAYVAIRDGWYLFYERS